jgi:hypothetical protein
MRRGVELGTAAVQRTDWGAGPMTTLDEAVAAVEHLKAPTPVLLEAIAYLACQVNGYRRSQNADAQLAMVQVARIVTDYQRRTS